MPVRPRWDPAPDEVTWIVSKDSLGYFPWANIVLSALAYLLFTFLYKKGAFTTCKHTVFLILSYACFIDLIETGQTIYFLIPGFKESTPADARWLDGSTSHYQKEYNIEKRIALPGTIVGCTLANWLDLFHYQLTMVVSIITFHRFLVRFCAKNVAINVVYKGLGIFFGIMAIVGAATFLFGTPIDRPSGARSFECRGIYFIDTSFDAHLILGFLYFAIALITPIFSILTIIRDVVKGRNDSRETVFLLIASLCMSLYSTAGFIDLALFVATRRNLGGGPIVRLLMSTIQDFRFPILCILAVSAIPEIREAVITPISEAYRKLRRKVVPFMIDYLITVEANDNKEIKEPIISCE